MSAAVLGGVAAFLCPANLQDIPRLFTAIAEFLAVYVFFLMYKRKYRGKIFVSQCVIAFCALTAFQFVAGLLPLWMWITMMLFAVLLMYGVLYAVLDAKPKDCGVITVHAFVLAEFAASLYEQLYVWNVLFWGHDTLIREVLTMAVVYAIVYYFYYRIERNNVPRDRDINITTSELFSVVVTGIFVFTMANLSFVNSNTPFSAGGNLLYVRTLVDFGGILMLMTQMGRRNEMAIKQEKDAIDMLFRRQYEQYRLAIDNSEVLRKEIHDMKHYVLALKNEDDPAKRAAVLADMEQAIAIQESFMNTGNKVLDVILTTKSLQCEKNHITLNAMVDGNLLSEFYVKDICSLFGNMLDNAIEATQMVKIPDNRLITLTVRRKNRFVIVECENYSEGTNVRLKKGTNLRFFKSNLPGTSKGDNVHHGYGLKSINQVAEKYGGAMTCSYEKEWFKVKVILPVVRG